MSDVNLEMVPVNGSPLPEKAPTYPSQTVVLKYLPLMKRSELTKGVKALRCLNSKIPFHFSKACILHLNNHYVVYFDNCSYAIYRSPEVDEPTTEIFRVREKLGKCLAYYLGHPDTIVENMKISILLWKGWVLNAKIRNLWLDWKHWKFSGEMLRKFRPSIRTLRLNALESIDSDWVSAISDMEAKKVHINCDILIFPQDLSKLTFDVLKLSHGNFDRRVACEMIEKFKYGTYGRGSAYRVRWERDAAFWGFLKGMFELEVESQSFFSTAVQNHTLELLVKHTEVSEEHFLVFTIVDRGTAEKEKTLEHWKYRSLRAVRTFYSDTKERMRDRIWGYLFVFVVIMVTLTFIANFSLAGKPHMLSSSSFLKSERNTSLSIINLEI